MGKAVDDSPLIIGIGPSAWPRIVTGFYFPRFEIVSYNDCQDNEIIKKFGFRITSLKKLDPSLEISPETPARIMSTSLFKEYLAAKGKPYFFLVYKSSAKLEELSLQTGWKIIANPKRLMEEFENKKRFKEILKEVGIEPIPGENIKIEELTAEKFSYYQDKYHSRKLVLQLAEVTMGGGSGTLFLDSSNDLPVFEKKVVEFRNSLEGKKKKIETVNIAPYIVGVTSSISCCATHKGVLTGPIQTQIIDIDEVGTKIPGRSGNYAGADWSFWHHSEDEQAQASRIAEKFGEYMYKKGYKGIFGLDLIVTREGKVWPVECNPRDTDAFPMITLLMMDTGGVPLEVFHCLEHIKGEDYDFDFKKVNEGLKKDHDASQIIIHNKFSDSSAVILGEVKAGIYGFKNNKFKFLRPGFMVGELKKGEYLISENVSKNPGKVITPHGRIFRLIKCGGMLDKSGEALDGETKMVVKEIYKALKLTPVNLGLGKEEGLNVFWARKLLDLEDEEQKNKIDLVNFIGEREGGLVRPVKIRWRKKIDPKIPVISQIRSKRARKQILADLKKLDLLEIKIKVVDEIDEQTFLEWLSLYKALMVEKGGGSEKMSQEWLGKKNSEGKKVGAILAFKDGKIIGGDLFFEKNGILSVGYGVAKKEESLTGGLMMLIDYAFLEHARSLGFKEVSFGQDTNFYGQELSTGLILYKAKLGFTPEVANRSFMVTSYLIKKDKLGQELVFFVKEGRALKMVVLTDKPKNPKEYYLPLGVEKLEILPLVVTCQKHKNLIGV